MKLLVWAILLVLQNFSFTAVSRARNSGSLLYHALASVASNGVWFASMFIIVDSISAAVREASVSKAIFLGLFYTTWTVVGSLAAHWFLMRFVEKGKRQIGAR